MNKANGHLIPNATISVKGSSEFTQSDSLGYFRLSIPAEYVIPEITLEVRVTGFPVSDTSVTISGKSFPIIQNTWVYLEEYVPMVGNIIPAIMVDSLK